MSDQAIAALRACVATIEEWYVQDQGAVLGATEARAAAYREVAALRLAAAVLRPRAGAGAERRPEETPP